MTDTIHGGAVRRAGARLAAVFTVVLFSAPLSGQVLEGRVEMSGRAVPGAPVELHRVTQGARGVVGETTTDAAGRFSLTLPPPADTGFTVYFATAVAHGVRYFGAPLHGNEGAADYRIQAFDTTSAAAAADSVRMVRRDVILSAAGGGGWEVAELVRLVNPTARTLVPDREKPVVGFTLPAGASAFEAGEGEGVSADSSRQGDLVKVGDRAWVRAPLVPGERDFVFRYRIPASPQRVLLPVERAVDSLTVYVRQPAPDAEVTGIPETSEFSAEGERFRRYVGASLMPGARVEVDWRGPAPAPLDPRWAALALAGIVLGIGAWLAWRRPHVG